MAPASEGRPLARRAAVPALLVAALLPAVLAFRWGPLAGNWGEQLTPWPDAVEYAAGAQALAENGRYYLQLGPWQVQPRYPPGFSLLLALPVRLGVPGDRLWRVAALFEWGVVSILALCVRALVRRLAPGASRVALLAGAGAALTWLLAPIAATQGSFVTSDQPTLLVTLLGGLAAIGALRSDRTAALWTVAGLATGLAATMRLVEGALLGASLLPLGLAALRRRGARRAARDAALFLAGVALPMLVAAGVLHRSGFPALRWSTYSLWEPTTFYSVARIFSLSNALHGGAMLFDTGHVFPHEPHARLVAALLTGWPGRSVFYYLGYLWPALALLALPWLIPRLRSAIPGGGPVLAAAGIWAALHAVVAALFIWPTPRLLLADFVLVTIVYWAAIGFAWTRPPRLRPIAAAAAVLALAIGAASAYGRYRDAPRYEDLNGATRSAFAGWLARQPDVARERVPFDSVRAQALGLLDRERRARIVAWGPLGESWHFRVLRRSGYVCFQSGYGWHLDDVLRPREGPLPPFGSR